MVLSGSLAAPLFSVFIPAWTDEFGWSRTAISGVFSFATVIAALFGPIVGKLLDTYGGRAVMTVGALLMGVSLISIGFVQNLIALYLAFSIGRMAMMNIQNLAGHTVIANWFIRRRAFATALAINGSRVGLGIWPLIAALIISFWGWREAFWILGCLVSLFAVVPWLLVVARRPEEIGLNPDGDSISFLQIKANQSTSIEADWTTRDAITTKAFWLLMVTHMSAMVAGGGFGLHRIPLFLDQGLNQSLIGPILLTHAVGMLIGGFFAAWLLSHVGHRLVLSVFMLAGVIVMLVAIELSQGVPMLIFTFIESAAFGGIFSILPVVYADYFGRYSIGKIRGITHPVVIASNAIGPLLAGYAHDKNGDYSTALVFFAVVLCVGSLCAYFASPPHRQEYAKS
tara:strand:- start:1096 stop:2289 length:1194 start_codon:yes stop_codon:yes gene_type:complete